MSESIPSSEPASALAGHPSVLAVLVVRTAEPALRECLHALANQSYSALGILAIDDATTDGSHDLLVRALGEPRVIRNEMPLGYARSFDAALAVPVTAAADYLFLVHGDTVLDPDAVTALVEATALGEGERVGVVGPKVVDLDRPRQLRDVGRSVDRFGHAMSPLQADEIDQGQFDRVLEVLAVAGCAMLVRREVWQGAGLYDERLGSDDVDLCWRSRIAGWRVLMTPRARVQHGAAHPDDDRPSTHSVRYDQDRLALAAVLKNYAFSTLAWVVPLGMVLTLVRLVFLSLARRFEEAYELLAAIGWNLSHLGGTWRRRRVAQHARTVRDHTLGRFTASAGLHLPRWFQTAELIIEEQRELGADEPDEPASRRLRHRTASFVSVHPVIVGAFLGVIVGAFAALAILEPPKLMGGVLPMFPSSANGFFEALVSGFRSSGLGGALAASPALGVLGGVSYASFASTALAPKVLMILGPAMAIVLCYRAAVRRTGRPGASVVAAAAYGLSALMLWSVSEGRIALLFVLVVLPPLTERIEVAFAGQEPTDGRWRFAVGLAVTAAVGVAFVPGVTLAFIVTAVVGAALGPHRRRGLLLVAGAAVGVAVLLFPFIPTIMAQGGHGLWSGIGQLDPWKLLRLSLGSAPGAWVPAAFLPVAALFGLALASGERRGQAARAALTAAIAVALAWLSVAGYLPHWASNAPVYAALAAVCEAFVVADGLASALQGLGRSLFGFRQIGSVLLAGVLAAGLSLQAIAVMAGTWAIGGIDRVPAAWSVLDASSTGTYNVLWLASPDGAPFPSPGGDPTGIVEAGAATVTYGLTGRSGALAIDTGRPLTGAGDPALQAALSEMLSGTTVHGGALLAPFGVRYVVVDEDGLPAEASDALRAQVDMDLVPSAGLTIWRDVVALPPAGVLQADRGTQAIVAGADPRATQRLQPVSAAPLEPTQSGWRGGAGDGTLAYVATEFDDAWELEGSSDRPQRAFGWATRFTPVPPVVTIDYGDQRQRTVAIWLVAVLWGAALWITRKPVRA